MTSLLTLSEEVSLSFVHRGSFHEVKTQTKSQMIKVCPIIVDFTIEHLEIKDLRYRKPWNQRLWYRKPWNQRSWNKKPVNKKPLYQKPRYWRLWNWRPPLYRKFVGPKTCGSRFETSKLHFWISNFAFHSLVCIILLLFSHFSVLSLIHIFIFFPFLCSKLGWFWGQTMNDPHLT